jgi:hypothetical protein
MRRACFFAYMSSNDIGLVICGALLTALTFTRAWPQQAQPPGDSFTQHTLHQPYSVETFGEFRRMMLTGDFTPKVQLNAAMAKRPTVGIGAVASARGEISIFDGKLVVSYGKTGPSTDASLEYAALLVIASAADWRSVRVEQDIAPESIEPYIAAAAKAVGIDTAKSFPFEVRGNVGPYVMHVNAAPTDGPHGMGFPMAITVENKGDEIDGLVTGIYVSTDLVGVATHGGERTHVHWVSLDARSTAHLDRRGLRAGAYLLLPKID